MKFKGKCKFQTYNDGFIYAYEPMEQKTDFNAIKNIKSIDNLKLVARLGYEELSRREEDIEWAESIDRSLSLKLKTRLLKAVKRENQIVIGDILYSIINIDYDRKNSEMYFYLEEVRKIAK